MQRVFSSDTIFFSSLSNMMHQTLPDALLVQFGAFGLLCVFYLWTEDDTSALCVCFWSCCTIFKHMCLFLPRTQLSVM